jgi:hypothetical protein
VGVAVCYPVQIDPHARNELGHGLPVVLGRATVE